jgi:pilus assembly protein Flp/PilA
LRTGRPEASKEAGKQTMRRIVSSFLADELGATAIEYSLIAAGIALVIVAAVNGIGTILNGTFASVQTGLK